MNLHHDLTYLAGGVDYFGENYGSSEVHTLARAGFKDQCPNLDKLLAQMTFTVPMENEIMAGIIDDGEAADAAAKTWLTANPDVLNTWLTGVTTLQGEDGLAAVKSALGL